MNNNESKKKSSEKYKFDFADYILGVLLCYLYAKGVLTTNDIIGMFICYVAGLVIYFLANKFL